jgi:hypothetical protein
LTAHKILLSIILIVCPALLASCGGRASTPPGIARSSGNPAGIWVKAETARNHGVPKVIDECVTNGITDIFLLVKGTSGTFTFNTLDEVIAAAHPRGLKVHAWVIVLQDHLKAITGNYSLSGTDTDWINATDIKYRNYIVDEIITPLARDHNIDGIHLDCIRYPGNANKYAEGQDAITGYCSTIRSVINTYKPSIPLSAAIMPEGGGAATYYGQNAAAMSPHLKFVTPMTYIHNYVNANQHWVGDQVNYFVAKCVSGCTVWAGIQTLDDRGVYLTTKEIADCVAAAMDKGATGIAFFTYPLTSAQWQWVKEWTNSL